MRSRDVPPQTYFVGSAVFHYLGPAFAVLLFARVAPLGVAWLRIASAAVVFAGWGRPWRPLRGAEAGAGREGAGGGGPRGRTGGDEQLLLRGDRAAPARHRVRDRVPAGDRACGG